MVEMDVVYEGDLRCRLVHGPSGHEVLTDAPVDNHGRGERFSPTDLLGAALGACLLTILGIQAEKHNLDLRGASVRVAKTMSSDPPRRIARLDLSVQLPAGIPENLRPVLERAMAACPVAQSLHPSIEKQVTVSWEV